MSFGKLEGSEPLPSDETAKRLMLFIGVVLIVVGVSLLVSSVASLSC